MKILILFVLCFYNSWAAPYKLEPRSINSRIVGGLPANAGQFTFSAAIYISKSDGNYFCGGALINSEWVLTAGQCVNGGVLFTIKLGTTSLQDAGSNVVTVATETYVLHPDFNSNTLEHDLGAIKFRVDITFTNYIQPINLLVSAALPDSTIVVTLGWGQISDTSAGLSNDLNYAYMSTVSNEECRIYYGNQITDNMVCVAGNYDESTCVGDSGAPLVQHTATGLYYYVGISSFHSGNGCESIEPSGFTRLGPYRDWIRNVTGV